MRISKTNVINLLYSNILIAFVCYYLRVVSVRAWFCFANSCTYWWLYGLLQPIPCLWVVVIFVINIRCCTLRRIFYSQVYNAGLCQKSTDFSCLALDYWQLWRQSITHVLSLQVCFLRIFLKICKIYIVDTV